MREKHQTNEALQKCVKYWQILHVTQSCSNNYYSLSIAFTLFNCSITQELLLEYHWTDYTHVVSNSQ